MLKRNPCGCQTPGVGCSLSPQILRYDDSESTSFVAPNKKAPNYRQRPAAVRNLTGRKGTEEAGRAECRPSFKKPHREGPALGRTRTRHSLTRARDSSLIFFLNFNPHLRICCIIIITTIIRERGRKREAPTRLRNINQSPSAHAPTSINPTT